MLMFLGCALISDDDLVARMDVDGDGVSRPKDCDDGDADVGASLVDIDGDGFGTDEVVAACVGAAVVDGGDCNDGDALAFPGAAERCNDLDDDCDGAIDEDAADQPTWYPDGDGDRYGSAASPIIACTAPDGFVDDATDCDDGDATVNPGVILYRDADADGWGDADSTTTLCDDTTGYVTTTGDCDDTRADVRPDGTEVCDAADADEDCDGASDDDDTSTTGEFAPWYVDADGDGYGDATLYTDACDAPSGYVADGRDCDDDDTGVGTECAWIDIAAGGEHSCGIRGSGLVECWGDDSVGQSSPPAGAFMDVAVSQNQGSLYQGSAFSCGVRADETLACWGSDPNGIGRTTPPAGTFGAVTVGNNHACAIATDGTVACRVTFPRPRHRSRVPHSPPLSHRGPPTSPLMRLASSPLRARPFR